MLSRLKLLLTAAIALTALTAAVGTAHATESVSFGPGGNIENPSLGKLNFTSSAATIRCEVTLRGTLSSFLSKLIELLLIGAITEVSINNPNCEGGTVTSLLHLPWRIVAVTLVDANFRAILGPEPRYKKIEIREVAFKLNAFGFLECLYEGRSDGWLELQPVARTPKHWTTGLIRADESVTTPLIEGSIFCPPSGGFTGRLGQNPVQSIIKL
jgi:hypothetical protein